MNGVRNDGHSIVKGDTCAECTTPVIKESDECAGCRSRRLRGYLSDPAWWSACGYYAGDRHGETYGDTIMRQLREIEAV